MRRPDIRQRVIEAVLDLAADAGVDDVHLIAALALHRRMTEAELRHAVGDRVYDAFAPQRPALQPRRRGPRQPGVPRLDAARRGGRDQQAGGGERPARLREHQPRRHGRRLEVDGHRPGLVPQPPPPPQRRDDAAVARVHGPAQQRAAPLQLAAWARSSRDAGVKVFQIETTLNTDIVPGVRSSSWPSGSGSGRPRDRATYLATTKALKRTPERMRAEDLPVDGVTAPDDGCRRRGTSRRCTG